MDTEFNKDTLNGLSDEERELAFSILGEFAKDGSSKTYDELLYEDYSEIPVGIEEFLHERRFLGNGLTDQDGRFTIFPYWVETLKDIFPTNTTTKYNTVVFTGAIGLGKSTIAVIILLYMLYRLLCLKDPYLYYGMQPIDKISISLMNITIENAKGVALDKMNQLILSSEWFMSHGKMVGIENLMYKPEKHIEVITASSNNQVIGRCLDGNTVILTEDGEHTLNELVGKNIKVVSIDDEGNRVLSDECTVLPTVMTSEQFILTLEDETVIECTPEHRFMMADGAYAEAKDLKRGDELFGDKGIRVKSILRSWSSDPKVMYDVVDAYPHNNFLVKTNSGAVCSHNCVFANFTDEVNFGLTNDVEKLKKKQKTLISQIDARMRSRFQRDKNGETYLPTINVIASSKNSEQSFLEDYIETKRKNESKTTLIVDEPQWVVDSRKDSKVKFQVAIGNKFLANELLPVGCPKQLIDEYKARGYRIIDVPIGYREKFDDDLDGSLNDIAGIATQSSVKYISGIRWNEIKTDAYKNPFTKEIIEVGTAKDDLAQYGDFFDMSRVEPNMLGLPMYVHLDMSKSNDKTGIAGVYIMGKRPSKPGVDSSRDMFYRVAFSVSVKAPKGYEISFDKNREFIRWLRAKGFNVKGVSSDTYQAAQIQQQLTADGFDVKTISMDRLDSETKTQLQYAYLKSTIYERRMDVYSDCDFLTDEVLGLEREGDGHIEHPEQGTQGSKDAIDAVTGALWNASKHADEYAYEYGENMKAMLDVNEDVNKSDKKQITVAFEDELKRAYADSAPWGPKKQDDRNADERLRAQQEMYSLMGIII